MSRFYNNEKCEDGQTDKQLNRKGEGNDRNLAHKNPW